METNNVFQLNRDRFSASQPPPVAGVPSFAKPKLILSSLASELHVSASTQNQALNSVLFLYRNVLRKEIGYVEGVIRAKRPQRLPVVLTRQEVKSILGVLDGSDWLMVMLLYGAGLRLMECLQLRVKDIDFTGNQILVRGGKGNKDRHTMVFLRR